VGALTIRADGLGTLGDLDYLDIGELQTFNQPTDWPSVSRTQLQTQHTLANRSGISASLVTTLVGGYKGIL
jgi:hypothetical protein